MAIAEREGARPPNPELPKGEVIFSRQLTLRELLEIKPGEKGETRNLLNDIPFNFEVRDLGDSLLHIASFSESYPICIWELFPLLKTAKPGGVSRGGQDTDGILADWRIILPEVREKDPISGELYDFHKEHVPGFTEFEENHFELFWKVLESGRIWVDFFNRQFYQFIDEREFFAKYGRQHASNNPMIGVFAMLHIEFFKTFLEEKGFNIPPDPGPEDPDQDGPTRKLFYSMDEQEQQALAIEFYEKSIDKGGIEVERQFGSVLRWIGRDLETTLIGENGELNSIDHGGLLKPLDVAIREKLSNPNPSHEEPDGVRRLENGQIELRKGELFIRISFVEGEDGYKKPKLEDHHLSTIGEAMVPIIVWQKNKQTEERSYYCGRYDEFPGYDTLLGQLVVAAYSPQVRDQMPLEVKMKGVDGQEKTQQMLEAQTVLLVPAFAGQFLTQSPVILGLEALAQQVVS